MQFGMPTLIECHTLEDNLMLCRELGLSFIELNMNFPEYQVHYLEYTDALKEFAEKAGVDYTIHLYEQLNIADFNPLVSSAYMTSSRMPTLTTCSARTPSPALRRTARHGRAEQFALLAEVVNSLTDNKAEQIQKAYNDAAAGN